jgi:hypothetical protein
MKLDKVVAGEVLFTASDVLRRAKVAGKSRPARCDGRQVLAVDTDAVVTVPSPRENLSPFNCLVLNLRAAEPFNGSLVTTLRCTTRSPGMAENDHLWGVLHFNQPTVWRGWQRIVMPAVNLVATGFPNGWRNIESLSLNLHSRHARGTVLVGDVELMQVESPAGPRMSDEELLAALDLDRPDLAAVARHARAGRTEQAVAAFAAWLRRVKLPHLEQLKYEHVPYCNAEEICRHYILGQQLPARIDWQANPIGYLEWNHSFNRHYWMPPLTAALEATGQARYAREIDYLARTWIEQNPEPVGHNGGLDPAWETLSTSCRINWAWGHILKAGQLSRGVRDRTLVDLAKMIHAHAEHLLKYWGHNNWFISESTAILTSAVLVPAFRRAKHWLATAADRLGREMRRQVRPDGAQFELSPGYHTMCADLFYLAWERGGFAGFRFPASYEKRLWSMFDYLAQITRPDGTHPVPNDSGFAMMKGNERLLQTGRARKRADWIWAGSGGAVGTPPRCGSVPFADAGHVVMRSGWGKDDRWAFFDVGEYGASHQHEDKLQVELYACGTAFLVDPGISSYQADPVVQYFRLSESHNTVLIDGLGQWRGRGRDFARYESSSRGRNPWASGKGLDFAQGRYDELYGDLSARAGRPFMAGSPGGRTLEGVAHTRALVFIRPDYWLILDSVEGPGTHEAAALWHFLPMHVRADQPGAIIRTNRLTCPNLELICRGDWRQGRLEIVTGREKPVQGFVAIDQEVKPAPCAIVSRRQRLPLHGVTVAVPYATGSESHFQVETAPAGGARGTAGMVITVARPGGITDRFLWRHTGKGILAAGDIRTDGLLSLVRTVSSGKVEYAAVAFGRSLRAGKLALAGDPEGLAETR